MLDLFQEFHTDTVAEETGVWREIGGGASLLIARANNRHYNKALADLYEKNAEALERNDDAADKLSTDLMIQVLADTILLGWKGVGYKRQPMEYSTANARTMLALRDFRTLVVKKANEIDVYKAKAEKETGNDSASS